ncbi:MAG: DUF488 domain-containing protein [Acidobacteria bacterium]|nr:DUF488 domain-containing protein [Acidobacteriota bacterium]MBV9478232.1 DUF488 domain-containing protein [Acidobacteriota bacterium]
MLDRIYTIGHSTRTLDELVALLREHDVARLADSRRYPGSRRHPQFSGESLAVSLPEHGIEYVHVEALGGRRRPRRDSPNGAWENEQFRGYADHMASPEFQRALDALLQSERATAVMCAEAVPWRCHRNLLSDELVRRGVEVVHIVGPDSFKRHALNPMACIDGVRLTYPPPQAKMFV